MFCIFDDEDGDVNVAFLSEDVIMMLLMEEMFQTMWRRRQRYTPPTDAFIKGWSKKALPKHNATPTTLRSSVSTAMTPHFNQSGGGLSDVLIGAQGEIPLYAHKVILGSWSKPLRKMILREELKSSQNGASVSKKLLRIETVEEKECAVAFKDFIKFMYTETINLSLQIVWAHIMLAGKYNVKELLLTCNGFIFKQVSDMRMDSTLKEVMISAKSHPGSNGVIQVTMQRLITELFLYEDDTVMSFDVDLLCAVLRSSDVVAISEFDIFLKLKPKLDALRGAGEHRQVLRLLSLLRLTQMTSSELRELVSSEYINEMRKAFPGKLKTALWIRALCSDQGSEELPINIEQSRLYLKNPEVNIERSDAMKVRLQREDKTLIKLEDVVLLIREGKQRVAVDNHNRQTVTARFPVYKVSISHHCVVKSSFGWKVEIPSGKFPVVTVYLIRPRGAETVNCKIVLALYKKTRGVLDPKPTAICYEGKDFTGLRKECTLQSMPTTGEELEISFQVVGYEYYRGSTPFHQVINPTQWLSGPPESKEKESLVAIAKVTTPDHGKKYKRRPNWVTNSKKKRKRKGKKKDW